MVGILYIFGLKEVKGIERNKNNVSLSFISLLRNNISKSVYINLGLAVLRIEMEH